MEASVFRFFLFLIIMIANSTIAEIHDNQEICTEARCGKNEPPIRFPFRLKDSHFSSQPNNSCAYPGFDLICIDKKTVIELPNSIRNIPIFVRKIDYKSQEIQVHSQSNCLLSLLLSDFSNRSLNSAFRFMFRSAETKSSYTVMRCSKRGEPCRTLLVRSDSEVQASRNDVVSCTKATEFESVPDEVYRLLWKGYQGSDIGLTWLKPDCRRCEAQGQGCRLKKLVGEASDETECFKNFKAKSKFLFVIRTTTIGASGLILLLLVILAAFYFYTLKKNEKESHRRIEKFLSDYNALKPSRYLYADIKKITNQFEEILGEGSYGTVFKGKLSNEIHVAVKILKNSKGNGDEFINEVATMTQIHHINVVRLVGYCADGFIRALIFEFLPNDSLEKYILGGSNLSLGWETLYNIALGVAKGIEYLHQGCDKRILHFDIKPRNILLDEKFVPKISDFGLSKLCGKDQSAVSMKTARGTIGYIAPEIISMNFGNVSYKSDIYSFGMLLLEMVGGRKNTAEGNDQDEIYYPEWIYNILEGGDDLRIIIQAEFEAKLIKKLAIVGLWCIQWNPIDRPSMKFVVQMLEGGDELAMPSNPFKSVTRNSVL